MQYGNWYLIEQTQRMRYEDMRRDADHAHFLKIHDLELPGIVRRVLRRPTIAPVRRERTRFAPRVRIVPAR